MLNSTTCLADDLNGAGVTTKQSHDGSAASKDASAEPRRAPRGRPRKALASDGGRSGKAKTSSGKPRKDDSLDKVLFIRCPTWLLDLIDAYVQKERSSHPGRGYTRSDAAREILYTHLHETVAARSPSQSTDPNSCLNPPTEKP